MAGWQVTEQAVAAMNNMAAQLQELALKIHQESEALKFAYEENQGGLGAHSGDISALIGGVEAVEQGGRKSLEKLQLKLTRAALIRQKHLTGNRYGSNVGTASGGDKPGLGVTVAAASVAVGMATEGALYGTNDHGSASETSTHPVDTPSMIREHGKEWTSKLSAEAVEALHAYTETAYTNINATLRGLVSSFSPGNLDRARVLHDILGQASLPVDCVVYRGVSSKALGALRFLPDQLLINKVFQDKGFMSTSINLYDTFGGDMVLEISARKSSHGVYIGYVSAAGHYESEVLFDAGQTMRITGVRRDSYGHRIVSVEIMR